MKTPNDQRIELTGARAPIDGGFWNPMTKNPEKDFGPIADAYAVLETHATEAEQAARAYVEHIGKIVPAEGPLRMLDFGCGSGTFTARFLQQTGWPPKRLRLTLVEPVESARRQAVARLAGL